MELPNDTSIRWLVRRYASLLARDTDRKRKLVLPTGEFFPDAFEGDQGSINLLFWRLQEHAALTDLDVELRLVDDRDAEASGCKCGEGGCKDGGCKEGGCGGSCGSHGKHERTLAPVVQLRDGGYRVDVRLSDAKNATTLTAALATSLAHAFVLETGGFESWPEAEWMSTCEVAASILGLGVLLTNASYMYSKACKGVNIEQGTSLDVSELSLVLAVFVALGEHPHGRAVQNLDPTQKEAYDEARMWVDSNAKILRRLRRDPGAVAADEHLTLESARPWLARLLGLGAKKKKTVDLNDEEAVAQIAAAMAAKRGEGKKRAEDPKMAELRALVDESLNEARSAAAEE